MGRARDWKKYTIISVSVRGMSGIRAVAGGSSFSRLWILRLEIMVVGRGGCGIGGPIRPGVRGEVRVVVVVVLAVVEWWWWW